MKKYNIFFAPKQHIHSDLTGRSCIMACLDFEKPAAMYDKANYFLNIIFDAPPSYGHNDILMMLFDKVMSLEKPLKNYGKFFTSPDNRDTATTTFARIYSLPAWAYQIVPKNAKSPFMLVPNDKLLQKKYNQNIVKMDGSSIALDIMMEVDQEEKKNNVD